VNEVQALGRARGVDTSRIAVQWRNDMYVKMRDGHPPCGSDCGWEGRMRGHPFDPAWILTVPRSEQRWAVEHRWGGDPRKDPWSEAGRDRWASWVDREAIAAVDTPERVAALYVLVHDTDPSLLHADPAPTVVGVDMDLRLPAYRAWSVQRLLADLRVLGIDPGEAAVVFYAYKPGWHVWYGGGRDPAQPCFVPDAHLWTGPAGTCPLPKRWSEGPFNRTPYGPGEFEASISAMLREMRAGLDGAGYDRVGIVTVERPGFTARKWSALAPDLRRAPWLLGELGTACDRREPARSRCPRR